MPIRFDVLVLAWCACAFLRDVGLMPTRAGQVLSGVLVVLMFVVVLVNTHPWLG